MVFKLLQYSGCWNGNKCRRTNQYAPGISYFEWRFLVLSQKKVSYGDFEFVETFSSSRGLSRRGVGDGRGGLSRKSSSLDGEGLKVQTDPADAWKNSVNVAWKWKMKRPALTSWHWLYAGSLFVHPIDLFTMDVYCFLVCGVVFIVSKKNNHYLVRISYYSLIGPFKILESPQTVSKCIKVILRRMFRLQNCERVLRVSYVSIWWSNPWLRRHEKLSSEIV